MNQNLTSEKTNKKFNFYRNLSNNVLGIYILLFFTIGFNFLFYIQGILEAFKFFYIARVKHLRFFGELGGQKSFFKLSTIVPNLQKSAFSTKKLVLNKY